MKSLKNLLLRKIVACNITCDPAQFSPFLSVCMRLMYVVINELLFCCILLPFSFSLVRGEIFGTRVLAWRGALSSRGVCLWHGVVTSSGWRGTGAEHGGREG